MIGRSWCRVFLSTLTLLAVLALGVHAAEETKPEKPVTLESLKSELDQLKEAAVGTAKSAETSQGDANKLKVAADTLWVMITGMLVFFMNLGFACVESGFCRSKNCVNILSKNFIVFAVASIGFWLIGWGLMFSNGNAWVGTESLFMVSGLDNSPATSLPGFEKTLKNEVKESLGVDLLDKDAADKHKSVVDAIDAAVKKFNETTANKLEKKVDGKVVKNKDGKPEMVDNVIEVKLSLGEKTFEKTYKTEDFYWGAYGGLSWPNVPLWAKFFFQLVFAGTAATIVSGAVAERIKYGSFILFSFVITGLIYPIVGHWVWGGGYLQAKGFVDFAGSTQVHSIGGWAALAGILILGNRIGKYTADGKPNAIPGHNLTAATIGCFVLWFGWFGFNPGSTMGIYSDPGAACEVAVTTNIAAAAATLSATIVSWLLLGKPDLGMTLNGCLAGLVAITAPCAFVSPASAVLIGLIAGGLVVLAVLTFDRLRIDDPVGATSVHLVNGVFGTICVGLFSTEDRLVRAGNDAFKAGLFAGGGAAQLLVQLEGVVLCAAFVFVTAAVTWLVLKYTVGIRVSAEEEVEGLDIGEHGNEAYYGFVMAKESLSIPMEPRAAIVPSDGHERYTLMVEGASPKDVMRAWSDICQRGKTPAKEFSEVYSKFTTVNANKFRFMGGDAELTRVAFEKLIRELLKNPGVKVHIAD
jgi:Amt family ammonium transporter